MILHTFCHVNAEWFICFDLFPERRGAIWRGNFKFGETFRPFHCCLLFSGLFFVFQRQLPGWRGDADRVGSERHQGPDGGEGEEKEEPSRRGRARGGPRDTRSCWWPRSPQRQVGGPSFLTLFQVGIDLLKWHKGSCKINQSNSWKFVAKFPCFTLIGKFFFLGSKRLLLDLFSLNLKEKYLNLKTRLLLSLFWNGTSPLHAKFYYKRPR